MKLYHGTNGAWLENILQLGVRPRGSMTRSNWHHNGVHSNPKCVYLTDSYAPYFAANASRGKNPSCAVVEVDTDRLDPQDLFPDEDFLEQASRKMEDAVPGTMRERTMHYRREQLTYNWPCQLPDGTFTTWWEASVRYLGTCSHLGPIPPSAITRAVWWPRAANTWMSFVWDPSISLANQSFMGDKYRELTRKLMAGEFSPMAELKALTPMERFEKHLLPAIEGWRLAKE